MSSDHNAITLDLHFTVQTKNHNKLQQSYNFNKADFDGLRSSLRIDPLDNLVFPDSAGIEGAWSTWKTAAFLQRIESFVPKRKTRKFITPPWIDGEALHAIRKKNSARKKAIQKDSYFLWDKFRRLRKE